MPNLFGYRRQQDARFADAIKDAVNVAITDGVQKARIMEVLETWLDMQREAQQEIAMLRELIDK